MRTPDQLVESGSHAAPAPPEQAPTLHLVPGRDGTLTALSAEPRAAPATGTTVVCIGVSFRTAPIGLRERLSYDGPALAAALARFGCGRETRPAAVNELVILSTCNRLEIYGAGGEGSITTLTDLIEETTGVPAREIAAPLYVLAGDAAVRHLCRVAAGLESQVVGEPQILGQVGDAFSLAMAHAATGPVLSTLFRSAIRAGRRARAETAIGRNPTTISSVAVSTVCGIVSDLRDAAILVVGAGEMAELAVAALHYRGARDIRVLSRTHEHALRLADRFGGRTFTYERLQEALAEADVVITSTAAPHHIITTAMVARAMADRPDRPLVLIDIALPRDVEPGTASVANVQVFDLDDLRRYIDLNLTERQGGVPRAEELVEEEAAECIAWLRQLDIAPLIADLRAHTEAIRRHVLGKAMRHFSHLPESDRQRIEAFSESLVNKVLHEPTARLKAQALSGNSAEYALAIRHLFGLTP